MAASPCPQVMLPFIFGTTRTPKWPIMNSRLYTPFTKNGYASYHRKSRSNPFSKKEDESSANVCATVPITQLPAAEKHVVKSTPLVTESDTKENGENVCSPGSSSKVDPQPLLTIEKENLSVTVQNSKTRETFSSVKSTCIPSLMDITFSPEKVLKFKQCLQQKYHRTASQIGPVPLMSIIYNLHNIILFLTSQFNLPFPFPSHHLPYPYPF